MQNIWVGCGALLGAGAVVLAAAGAHGMEARGPQAIDDIRAAAQICGWHALALLFVGLWAPRAGPLADLAGGGFALGALVFAVAVVGNVFGVPRVVYGAPVGGTLLIAGWLVLAASAVFGRA